MELSLNVQKTVHLTFTTQSVKLQSAINIKIRYDDSDKIHIWLLEISGVYRAKYQGITIDSLLQWDTHNVISKNRYFLYIISKLHSA